MKMKLYIFPEHIRTSVLSTVCRTGFFLFLVSFQLHSQTIIVTKERDLNFGVVWAGNAYEIAVDAAEEGSALLRIDKPRFDTIIVNFILPSFLQMSGSDQTIPLQFCPFSAAWNTRMGNIPGGRRFNPTAGVTISRPPSTEVFIWLGGSINISPNQPAGTYTGTIVINVESTDQ